MLQNLPNTDFANEGDTPQTPDLPDFEQFNTRGGVPCLLANATKSLIELAQKECGHRFGDSFFSYSESIAETRAAFRFCRAALDFLEADFLAAELDQLEFLRGQVAAIEAMRGEAQSKTD